MAYPFDSTPLDSYLEQLNKVTLEDIKCYRVIYGKFSSEEEKEVARKNLILLNKRRQKVKNDVAIPSRQFDTFLGTFEMAIKSFKDSNPKPPKPSSCQHQKSEKRVRYARSGVIQIVTQCLVCGSPICDHKKANTPGWEKLPPIDRNIINPERALYNDWHKKYQQVIQSALGDKHQETEFDYQAFYDSYINTNPEPLSPATCSHQTVTPTLRRYSTTNIAVVEQCKICGHHVRAIPKKDIPHWKMLPDFDTTISAALNDRLSKWYAMLEHERKQAFEQHRRLLDERISSGDLVLEDKSTFGTYYKSSEWQRTRIRILARDDNQCQACLCEAQCVHHIVYDRLGCENDYDLISLCNQCHNEVHERQNMFPLPYRLSPTDIKTLHEWSFVSEIETATD